MQAEIIMIATAAATMGLNRFDFMGVF